MPGWKCVLPLPRGNNQLLPTVTQLGTQARKIIPKVLVENISTGLKIIREIRICKNFTNSTLRRKLLRSLPTVWVQETVGPDGGGVESQRDQKLLDPLHSSKQTWKWWLPSQDAKREGRWRWVGWAGSQMARHLCQGRDGQRSDWWMQSDGSFQFYSLSTSWSGCQGIFFNGKFGYWKSLGLLEGRWFIFESRLILSWIPCRRPTICTL